MVLLNNRINFLKGATADIVQEAEDIDAKTVTIMEGDDYKRGATIKRLFEEVQEKEKEEAEGSQGRGRPAGRGIS